MKKCLERILSFGQRGNRLGFGRIFPFMLFCAMNKTRVIVHSNKSDPPSEQEGRIAKDRIVNVIKIIFGQNCFQWS